MILSSNKVLPSDPGDPIELTTRHYPYPFLPYSPSFWPGKPFLCPEINHSPGLDYSKFCPFHRYAGHTIEECHTLRDVIYDMNDENRINWNEVKAYLKAANVTEATGDLY